MMPDPVSLRTDRLWLRPWCQADREPFAKMCANAAVMEFFPSIMSRAESDASVDRIEAGFVKRGWGLWAVEVLGQSPFIGFVGLNVPSCELPCSPCVEIGWRLMCSAWGQGFATEAARAVLSFGFETLHLPEIVSYTAEANRRSRRVMDRLGMSHDPVENFDHPLVPEDNWLRRHVLYRKRAG